MQKYSGKHYIVDTGGDLVFDKVMYKGENQFTPWTDKSVAVSVLECVKNSDCDFSPVADDGEDITDDAIFWRNVKFLELLIFKDIYV